MPSPLKAMPARMRPLSWVSSTLMVSASALPRLFSVPGRSQQAAVAAVVGDVGQGQGQGTALGQGFRILEEGQGPLDGGDQFRGPDVAVLVAVDQGQGLRIELQPGRGTDRATQSFWSSW